MAKYTARRVIKAIVTVLYVACLTLNAKYGLDQPKIVQLGKFLGILFHGDFGTSIKMQKNRAVLDIIKDMFPVSA